MGNRLFFQLLRWENEKNGDRIDMPVNITIAHAVADGYHIGLFFEYLQNEINALKN